MTRLHRITVFYQKSTETTGRTGGQFGELLHDLDQANDRVSADTVIGLIEVMKQFSELTAGTAGRLGAFLVEDGDPVEPGQVVATLDDE